MTKISAIVCTYRGFNAAFPTIESLYRQDTRGTFSYEILVVDNTELRFSANEINRLRDFDDRIRYLRVEKVGLSNARNAAVLIAKGDFVAFIDDDALADKYWLFNLLQTYKSSNIVAVGGKVVLRFLRDKPNWLDKGKFVLFGKVDYGDGIFRVDRKRYPIGANISFRRSILINIGLFPLFLGRVANNSSGGEENFVLDILSRQGYEIWFNSNAVVFHKVSEEKLSQSYFFKLAFESTKSMGVMLIVEGRNLLLFMRFIKYFFRVIIGSFVSFSSVLSEVNAEKNKFSLKYNYYVLKGIVCLLADLVLIRTCLEERKRIKARGML